jgi:hypothetical protein
MRKQLSLACPHPGESMSVEPALASIQLIALTDVWPPLSQEPAGVTAPGPAAGQAASTAQPRPSGARSPALDPGEVLARQFAVFLVECLAGIRPARQLTPWLSKRGSVHLHRLMPLFADGHQPRVLRVLSARPAPDVIEMTMVVVTGPRTRALAVRLERAEDPQRWRCTDIETALPTLLAPREERFGTRYPA